MDILIVGGLLVVGVAALVALFLVVRSGNTSQSNIKARPQTVREEPPTPIQSETIQPEPLHAAVPAATEVRPEPVEPQGVPETTEDIQHEQIEPQPLPEATGTTEATGTLGATEVEPEPVAPQDVPETTEAWDEPAEPRKVPTAKAAFQNGSSQDGTTVVRSMNDKEQPLRVHLNGQFHELTTGLRSLQQQAIEMEQRLNSLTQMLESIESDPPKEK